MNLPATVYCNAYWSLLCVLYHSSWPSSLQTLLPSLKCSVQDLQKLRLNSKPFPGIWTCRAGVVLWRPAFWEDTIRTFRLSGRCNSAFKYLTKVYWHHTLTASHEHRHFGLLEAGQRTDRKVLASRLLREHARLIKSLNIEEKTRTVPRSRPKCSLISTTNASRSSEGLRLAVDGGRALKVIINTYKTTSGVMKRLINRVSSYTEPSLEKGKVRVRWRCVSTPAYNP